MGFTEGVQETGSGLDHTGAGGTLRPLCSLPFLVSRALGRDWAAGRTAQLIGQWPGSLEMARPRAGCGWVREAWGVRFPPVSNPRATFTAPRGLCNFLSTVVQGAG